MKYLHIILCLLVSWPAISIAQVSPFGLTIGEATLDEVHLALGKKTKLTSRGTNKWTGGPMLRAPGDGLGVEGLQEALFIFDQQNLLMGVVLTLPKNRYADINAYLSDKYTMTSEQAPFVGNKSAKYTEGEVTIEANAPHLSFQMAVNYIHNSLQYAFTTESSKEAEQKALKEGAQL